MTACEVLEDGLLKRAEELAATGSSLFDVLDPHSLASWVRALMPGADAALAARVHSRAVPGRVHLAEWHASETEDDFDDALVPMPGEDPATIRARAIAQLRGLAHLYGARKPTVCAREEQRALSS